MKLNHKIHDIKVSYILFNMCDIISLSKIKATTINPGLEACNKKLPLHCWFARDVKVAMLVVKNKRISLPWELNSIFM